MTLLTTNEIPEHSPWHIASGLVVTFIAMLFLTISISYLAH